MKVDWVPSGWDVVQVGDVVEPFRRAVSVDPGTLYYEIGIRSHGKGIFYKEPVSGKELGDKRVFWIESGCFIVNIVFAWEGAAAQTTQSEVGMIASHRFPMYKPLADALDLDFITYFFKSKRGVHLLGLASPGGAGRNKTLGQQNFLQLEIPLPPLEEQKKIAAILQTCDETIDLTVQLITAKQQRKKALLQRLLTGEIRFPGFDDNWSLVSWEEIFTFLRGCPLSRSYLTYENTDDTIFNIHYGDIHSTYISEVLDFSSESRVPIVRNSSDLPQNIDYLIDGDLIIADVSEDYAGIGVCVELTNLEGRKVTGGLHTFVVRDEKGMTANGYRGYILKAPQVAKKLRQLATGVSVYGISKSSLSNLQFHLPSLSEQRKIATVLAACNKEINLLQQKLTALRRQKQGLMQQLLTGKIRVKV